jgi:hypothetical protein
MARKAKISEAELRQLLAAWREDMKRKGIPIKESDIDHIMANQEKARRVVAAWRKAMPKMKNQMLKQAKEISVKRAAKQAAEWAETFARLGSLPIEPLPAVPPSEREAAQDDPRYNVKLLKHLWERNPDKRDTKDLWRLYETESGHKVSRSWIQKWKPNPG